MLVGLLRMRALAMRTVHSRALSRQIHVGAGVPATFYRGGTSRGLFFRTRDLAGYTQAQRDAIICHAMGSPDPDGRQITGLGGGISSLSKCAIVGPPGSPSSVSPYEHEHEHKHEHEPFLGTLPRANDVQASQDPAKGWEVVYRFGQVPINGTKIDWGSTCGNLVAAAATFAIDSGAIPQAHLAEYAASHPAEGSNPYEYVTTYPVRLFVACSGSVITANIPLVQQNHHFVAAKRGDTTIAGVPGKFPGVQVAIPLPEHDSIFPSGAVANQVGVDLPCLADGESQKKTTITLVDAGLAVSFVSAEALGLTPEDLASPVSDLELPARGLMQALENLRYAGGMLSEKTRKIFSPPEPKICIVAPAQNYTTSSGTSVQSNEMDLLIRAVSVGNIHRTVPATTLSALAVAAATPGTVVHQIAGGAAGSASRITTEHHGRGQLAAIRAGQPAGISSATVRIEPSHDGKTPPVATDIVMERSANVIISGVVNEPF